MTTGGNGFDWRLGTAAGVALAVAVIAVVVPLVHDGGQQHSTAPSSVTSSAKVSAAHVPTGTRSAHTAAPSSAVDPNGLSIGDVQSGLGTRAPQSADRKSDEAALRAVIPKWGVFSLSTDTDPDTWEGNFDSMPEVSDPFASQCISAFYDLWGGAMQQGVSVTRARIVSIKQISNTGPMATYSVTVAQTISGASGSKSTVEQRWTFDVAHTVDGSQLLSYLPQTDED